jgi:hypothetical protein
MAFCIEASLLGRRLLEAFRDIAAIDAQNIQFCCAEWFWKTQVNSYVLQVEPDRFKRWDEAVLPYKEALYIEGLRRGFFEKLNDLVQKAGQW